MNYTDTQLKQALAKMLPDKVHLCDDATQELLRVEGFLVDNSAEKE